MKLPVMVRGQLRASHESVGCQDKLLSGAETQNIKDRGKAATGKINMNTVTHSGEHSTFATTTTTTAPAATITTNPETHTSLNTANTDNDSCNPTTSHPSIDLASIRAVYKEVPSHSYTDSSNAPVGHFLGHISPLSLHSTLFYLLPCFISPQMAPL